MELSGTIQGRGALTGSFDFDQADYNLLKNKPSINGVTLIGNKTSEDLHISSGGGGGGTNNYNDLENKPKINDVILQDELSLHSLGIQPEIEFSGEPTEFLNGNGQFTTPYTPPDISTSEVETGYKWDGKKVYMRYCESGTIEPQTQQATPFLTNIDKYMVIGSRSNIDTDEYTPLCISMYNYQGAGTIYGMVVYNKANQSLYFFNMSRITQITMSALILYTKN